MVKNLKAAVMAAYCVVGIGLNLAKIPGEFNADWKLPPPVEAIVDAMSGAQFLPSSIGPDKKNSETYIATSKKMSDLY